MAVLHVRRAATLTAWVAPGDIVQFYLDSPGLIVRAPAFQEVQWRGAPVRSIFKAQVPKTAPYSPIESVLHVAIDNIPIGGRARQTDREHRRLGREA
jgi:hypothetical protein